MACASSSSLKPMRTASLVVTEKSSGSDLGSIQMTAKYNPDDETYWLTGTKTWVPNPHNSDLFVVVAKNKSKNYMGEEEVGLTVFLVDSSKGGVSVGNKYDATAYSGLHFADVEFNCKGDTTWSSHGIIKIFLL